MNHVGRGKRHHEPQAEACGNLAVMRSSAQEAKARIKDTDIPLCHLLPGVSLVVVNSQILIRQVVEEAEERGSKNPDPSGTLAYLKIKGTLLSRRHVEVIPIAQQELLHGALIAEKK